MADRWGAWVLGERIPLSQENIEAASRATGTPLEQVIAAIEDEKKAVLVLNNIYQVSIKHPNSDMVHLSIKRRDRAPIGVEHFRDFQRIKNELVSPESEAVEIYPAESRLVDTSNQYHLWVFVDDTFRLPFGFSGGRLVLDESVGNAVQRPKDT